MMESLRNEREGWHIEREAHLKKLRDEREGWRIEREVHLKKMRDQLQAEKNTFEETLRTQKMNEMASYVKRLDVKATKIAEGNRGGDHTPQHIDGPPVAEGSRGSDRVDSRRGNDRVESGKGKDRVMGTPLRRSSSRRTRVPRAPVLVEEESDSDDVVSIHPVQQVKAEAPLPLEDQRIAAIVENVMRRLGLGTALPQQSATKRDLARRRVANKINVETYVKVKPQHLKFLVSHWPLDNWE
jgi:hypothetical protein